LVLWYLQMYTIIRAKSEASDASSMPIIITPSRNIKEPTSPRTGQSEFATPDEYSYGGNAFLRPLGSE
jgi:hypothetical protein